MKTFDMETLFIVVICSIMLSIGIITFFGGLTGIAILEMGMLTVGGIFLGLAGIIFGIMAFMYLIER